MEWTATGEPLSTNVTLHSVKWLSEDNSDCAERLGSQIAISSQLDG